MNINNFFVLGIDHQKTNTKEREKFIKSKPQKIIEKYFIEKKIESYVNLLTCLRAEFYVYGKKESVEEILSQFSGENIFIFSGEEALNHLFRVICGFESVIKGETQILAQIKKSYKSAFEEKLTNTPTNVIFNRAIEVGKKFRTISKINHNALSLEAISLKFIKEHVDNLKEKKVFILGTGDLSQSILYLLKCEGVEDITITNRSYHKAYEVKNIYNVNVADFSEKNEISIKSQVIISTTSAPHYILKYPELKDKLNSGEEKVLLDLAVPKDIDERIGDIEGINLYNLDDVWEAYEKNVNKRSLKLEKYYYLLEEQEEKVKSWFYYKNRLEDSGE